MSSKSNLNKLLQTHFPTIQPLTPFQNNITAALITIIYVKTVMEIGALIRRYANPEVSRKFIHLCACSLVIFWPLFDDSHWGWRLNVIVPVVMSARLFYKGAIVRDPEDEDVHLMSRTSSPSELLYGPLQMTLIMIYVGLTKFATPEVGAIIMSSFIGDAFAAIIGIQYGRYTYKVPLGGTKSIEGNIGCILGTILGIRFYLYVLGIEKMELKMLLTYGVVSTVSEATAVKDWDNLVIFGAMELAVKYMHQVIIKEV